MKESTDDLNSFGPWEWVDGSAMDYMNHNDMNVLKEESSGGRFLCGLMHSDAGDLGEWDDDRCGDSSDPDETGTVRSYGYICKLPP